MPSGNLLVSVEDQFGSVRQAGSLPSLAVFAASTAFFNVGLVGSDGPDGPLFPASFPPNPFAPGASALSAAAPPTFCSGPVGLKTYGSELSPPVCFSGGLFLRGALF